MFDTRIHDTAISSMASRSYNERYEQIAAVQEAKRIRREARREARAEKMANAILANHFVTALIGGAKRI